MSLKEHLGGPRADRFYCKQCDEWKDVIQHEGVCRNCFSAITWDREKWKGLYVDISQRFEHLRKAHDATLKENLTLAGERNRARRQRDNHKKRKSEWKRRAEGLQRTADNLRVGNDAWQKEKADCMNHISSLKHERDPVRDQNKHLNECLADLTTQIIEATSERKDAEQERDALIAELQTQGYSIAAISRAINNRKEMQCEKEQGQ